MHARFLILSLLFALALQQPALLAQHPVAPHLGKSVEPFGYTHPMALGEWSRPYRMIGQSPPAGAVTPSQPKQRYSYGWFGAMRHSHQIIHVRGYNQTHVDWIFK